MTRLWAVNVGNSLNSFTSSDGSVVASVHLDLIPKRAGFGVAKLVNSCMDIIGQRPNCKFKWIRRSSTSFKMHNQYHGSGEDCAEGVLEVIDEIQPGEQLFWSYNYHAVHGNTPVKPPRKKTDLNFTEPPVGEPSSAVVTTPIPPPPQRRELFEVSATGSAPEIEVNAALSPATHSST